MAADTVAPGGGSGGGQEADEHLRVGVCISRYTHQVVLTTEMCCHTAWRLESKIKVRAELCSLLGPYGRLPPPASGVSWCPCGCISVSASAVTCHLAVLSLCFCPRVCSAGFIGGPVSCLTGLRTPLAPIQNELILTNYTYNDPMSKQCYISKLGSSERHSSVHGGSDEGGG